VTSQTTRDGKRQQTTCTLTGQDGTGKSMTMEEDSKYAYQPIRRKQKAGSRLAQNPA
jgi:hypothetical protein